MGKEIYIMLLARNSRTSYAAAGCQDDPRIRMNVRSNVYVPDSEVRENCDGRPMIYMAPAEGRRRPAAIPLRLVIRPDDGDRQIIRYGNLLFPAVGKK